MTTELEGGHDGEGLKIGIVVARFNELITSNLLTGARASLSGRGVRDGDVTVAWVPGSFELPLVAKKMAGSGRFDAVICLGAVIRGETDHYQHVAEAAARGVANAALESGVPVVFGVLTTDTVEQALERAGGAHGEYVESLRAEGKGLPGAEAESEEHGNAGFNAGDAAVEMANLLRRLDSS